MFTIDETASLQAPTFTALLYARVAATPDATMLLAVDGTCLSFAGYAGRAERMAAWLFSQGIRPGMRVTWQLPTTLQAAVLIAALARLGVVQNPIIHLYRDHEVRQILRQNRPDYFVTALPDDGCSQAIAARQLAAQEGLQMTVLELPDFLPIAEPAKLPALPYAGDVPAWVFYTSGTTSAPKGALHCDQALIDAGRGLAESYQVMPRDIGSIAYPIAHIGGPMYLAMLLISGASALLLRQFSPASARELFQRYGVTLAGGSTAHYLGLLNEQAGHPGERLYPTLRVLGGGGAAKPPELFLRARQELDVTICHSYGMTECPALTIAPVDSSDEQLAYTDGVPRRDLHVRIVQADGSTAPAGVADEVRVRGRGVFLGYIDPEQNREAFDAEGFYRTGDLAVLRVDGYLTVSGRLKDIIIRKGENISAKEIEDLLSSHPKVSEAAVIGLPDAECGERICAVIELRPGAEPLEFEEMRRYFEQAAVMRQKIPERLEIMDRLPRNDALNKVLKNKLRELLATT